MKFSWKFIYLLDIFPLESASNILASGIVKILQIVASVVFLTVFLYLFLVALGGRKPSLSLSLCIAPWRLTLNPQVSTVQSDWLILSVFHRHRDYVTDPRFLAGLGFRWIIGRIVLKLFNWLILSLPMANLGLLPIYPWFGCPENWEGKGNFDIRSW